jgi:putative zinc finger/helix-turn-helix YgiT family protein
MPPSPEKQAKRPRGADRPFPWRCRHCGKQEVALSKVSYDAEVRHDGRLYAFTVPSLELPICSACGEKVFTNEANEQIGAALRAHLGLLTPEEIRRGLERLGLTQKETAQRLGIAEATLSHWLTDTQIQSRAMDNLMRLFLESDEVRELLARKFGRPGGNSNASQPSESDGTRPAGVNRVKKYLDKPRYGARESGEFRLHCVSEN